MPLHIYYPTRHFAIKLKRIKRKDPNGHDRIQDVIVRILDYPHEADGKMVGVHHGRFKKYVGRRDYRIIYYFCKICRKMKKRQEERCEECEIMKDNTVVFFDVYHKNEVKKIKDTDF